MLLSRGAQDLSSFSPIFLNPTILPSLNPTSISMRTTLSLLHNHQIHHRRRQTLIPSISSNFPAFSRTFSLAKQTQNKKAPNFSSISGNFAEKGVSIEENWDFQHTQNEKEATISSLSNDFVKKVVPIEENWNFQPTQNEKGENLDFRRENESEAFEFDGFESTEMRRLATPLLEVKELEEMPEQWRRSKLAWLCKELPSHKSGTLVRILNAQRKWMTQEDVTYVAVHCLRIRENEAGYKVYKWMMQQSKYNFDFALATKLADYMGKERKFVKCRNIFDDIINQGRVPTESTFHILVIAYLSSSVQGCLEEACSIYNRMIQLGGYKPSLSLHNSLFRALISKPGSSSKIYLKQAEFIFHNLVTCGLEIHKDIFGGLIWLHSYQDTIDKTRIMSLRNKIQNSGFEESREVLVSILRACSKEGDVNEAEKTWLKLLQSDTRLPSQAFVYKMEVYAKNGETMKSLEIFRDMQKSDTCTSVVAYHKMIELLSKSEEIELAESLMKEFMESNMKPLMPSYIDLMNMYFELSLHDKLESTFYQCLEKCRPNRTAYNIFLDSLVKVEDLDKAEEIFNQMLSNEAIGVNARSCNTILQGFFSGGDYVKSEKIYDLMCQKKYEIDPPLMDKLDYVLSLSRTVVKKPISLKLSKDQREVLVGLLLGGLRMESDEKRKNHVIHFEFKSNSSSQSILKLHLYDEFHEWLNPSSNPNNDRDDNIPDSFFTVAHSYFGFYADQFWPKGQPMIPKLIHRWLSPRVLAYWYMYGGHRTSSGDILLKLKGNPEGVENVVKTLRGKSLDCMVKRKGRVFWIGFRESNVAWFWKLIEPYVLDEFKVVENPMFEDRIVETPVVNFDSGSESE